MVVSKLKKDRETVQLLSCVLKRDLCTASHWESCVSLLYNCGFCNVWCFLVLCNKFFNILIIFFTWGVLLNFSLMETSKTTRLWNTKNVLQGYLMVTLSWQKYELLLKEPCLPLCPQPWPYRFPCATMAAWAAMWGAGWELLWLKLTWSWGGEEFSSSFALSSSIYGCITYLLVSASGS